MSPYDRRDGSRAQPGGGQLTDNLTALRAYLDVRRELAQPAEVNQLTWCRAGPGARVGEPEVRSLCSGSVLREQGLTMPSAGSLARRTSTGQLARCQGNPG